MSRRALLLALLAVLFVSACGDSTAPNTSITGVYPLRTVNGASLPYVETFETTRVELLSESITLLDGGAFRVQGSVRITDGTLSETETFTEQGTFTRAGSSITFTVAGEAEAINGTLANDTITFTSDGLTFVFRK